MSVLDQIVRTVEAPQLTGKLREIDDVLARVREPGGDLSPDEALRQIGEIVGPLRPHAVETYQKPWG